jgi:hypothetical protein
MEPSLTVTALVETDLVGKSGIEMLDLQNIGQEFDQFEDPGGNSGVALPCPGVASPVFTRGMVRALAMQMLLDMQDTAAGWTDDIVEIRKIFDEQIVTAAGEMPETRISHWLAATGLIRGIYHFATQLFQQLQGGDAHLRIKLIDITGYE